MAVHGAPEDNTPGRHAVRVDWFRRDPGGTTTYVIPPDDDGPARQPITEHDDGADRTSG